MIAKEKWFKIKRGEIHIGHKEEVFYDKCSEALANVGQRGSGWPILGNIQGQAGLGSEQSDWAVCVPVHGELDQMIFNGPFQLKSFSDSMISSIFFFLISKYIFHLWFFYEENILLKSNKNEIKLHKINNV